MLRRRATLSAIVLGLSALTIATGMPTIHDSMTDRSAISAVIGPRRNSMSATLSERKKEWPKLPSAIDFTQARYCIQSGSLSPRSRM